MEASAEAMETWRSRWKVRRLYQCLYFKLVIPHFLLFGPIVLLSPCKIVLIFFLRELNQLNNMFLSGNMCWTEEALCNCNRKSAVTSYVPVNSTVLNSVAQHTTRSI